MPARDVEQLEPSTEPVAPEVTPEPVAAKTDFEAPAEVPAVATTTAATATTASELAFGQESKPDTSFLDKGIHHWEDYKDACEKAGQPDKWKPQYRVGHTEAKGWINPHDRYKVSFEWQLEKGYSASKAVADFIKGPTIADYRVAGVAADLQEICHEFGDRKFDKLFGSANGHEDAAIPMAQRLQITAGMYSIPLKDQLKAIANEAEAREKPNQEPTPAPVQEARVEEKPKAIEQDQEPVVVAQELGMQQADRELV